MLLNCVNWRGGVRRSPERSYMMVVDCVWGRGGRGVRGDVVSGAFFFVLVGLSSPLYASSSKPMPTLCPPALKFLPSIRAERVTFTPGRRLWV